MTLRIYNTLTEKKEEFIPLNKNKVKIFTCGPTVYDSPHLGHARTYIFYDVMIRYLKLKYNVEYIVNITDIDDKIYQRALELKVDPNHLTTKYTTEFIECIKQLNIQDIKYKKASDHLSEIFNQIKILLNKGFAYKIKDEVYFNTNKLNDYGKLSKQNRSDLMLHRLELNPVKRNQSDFLIWRKENINYPCINSPFGKGRPGWHIEDTAITISNFGDQYDIHGGAEELIFPHHECEIAQAESITGKKPLVKYWVHTSLLNINNRKMSKSLKNDITIKTALKKYGSNLIRLYFFNNNYKKLKNLDLDDIFKVKKYEKIIFQALDNIEKLNNKQIDNYTIVPKLNKTCKKFFDNMDNNFNTQKALENLIEFSSIINKYYWTINRNTRINTHYVFFNLNNDKKNIIKNLKTMINIIGITKIGCQI